MPSAAWKYAGPAASYALSLHDALPILTLYGPRPGTPRTPTLAFTLRGRKTDDIARALARRGLFVSNGDFYAATVIERLGQSADGVVRDRKRTRLSSSHSTISYAVCCLEIRRPRRKLRPFPTRRSSDLDTLRSAPRHAAHADARLHVARPQDR